MPLSSPDITADMPKVEQEVPKPNIEPKIPQPQGEVETEMVDVIDSNASNPDEALKALSRFSLKDKLLSRFRRENKIPAEVAEKQIEDMGPLKIDFEDSSAPEASDLDKNDSSSPEIQKSPETVKEIAEPLDPAVEYQKALDEVVKSVAEDPFAIFEKHIKKPEPAAESSSQRSREFTSIDQLRHKLLALEARRQGVSDIEGFNRLVEYFETSFPRSDVKYATYKGEISDKEREHIRQLWKKIGYDNVNFSKDSESVSASASKNIHLNVARDNVPVLKAILETGHDPIPLLEALKPNMHIYPPSLLSRHDLKSSYPSDTTKFLELLQDPNIERVLPLMHGMSSVPHAEWKLHSYREEKTQADELQELAAGNILEYSPEFFARVNLIARSLGRKVELQELSSYQELISNADKLNFLSEVVRNEKLPRVWYDSDFNIFESLNSLERDSLLKPLATLMQSDVSIDRRIFGGYKSYDSESTTQDEVNQELLEFIKEPSIEAILNDQDKQVFAQVLGKMNGERVSASLVEELYPMRQDLAALNNLIFPSLDSQYKDRSGYRNQKIEMLKTLLGNEDRIQTLLSPAFRDFIMDLQNNTDFKIQPQDFFKSGKDLNDYHGEYRYRKKENVLVQLFKLQEVTNLIDPSMTRKIIEGFREGYKTPDEWYRLKDLVPYAHTIRILKQHGIPLDPENFKDDKWIAEISRMPLMNYEVWDKVPEDRMREWFNACQVLPYQLQESLLESFRGGDYINDIEIDSEKVERVIALERLFSTSDFFPKDRYWGNAYMQNLYRIIGSYDGDINTFFRDGRPTPELAHYLIASKNFASLPLILPDVIDSFDENSQQVLNAWIKMPFQLQKLSSNEIQFPNLSPEVANRYKMASDIMSFAGLQDMNNDLVKLITHAPNYKDFLVDGRPSKTFIDEVIRRQDFQSLPIFLKDEVLDQYNTLERRTIINLALKNMNLATLSNFLTENVLAQYNDTERSVIATWMRLPEDLRAEVLQEAPDFPDIPPDKAEKYRVAVETISRLRNSPSAEIKRLEKELIGQLWKLDNPQQALEEIISIFEKNNLPLVGKTYRVFETIYDNPNTSGGAVLESDLSSKTNLSPVLTTATARARREIIYRDLLSINVKSANPQLRDYLEVIRDGENVVSRLENDGIEVLTDRERLLLGHFLDKMDMLYSASLFGRTIENRKRARHIDSSATSSILSPAERIQTLRRNFRARADQKLTDRLSEMFLKPIGLSSIEEVLVEMDRAKIEADSRNREFVQANVGKIVLKAGDRFKGVGLDDFGKILERGAVAREYLGASAGSDATPYDTDTGLILEQDLANGVTSAVSSSPSTGYGDILLVVKDRNQFGNGTNQYESFASGVVGERHYGIRTGFPSSEIDAVIAKDSLSSDYKKMDDLFITMAQHGQYIPVATIDGNVIFTSEQFDQYRKTFDGVSEYSQNPVTVRRVGIGQVTYSFPDSPRILESTKAAIDQLRVDITQDREKVESLSNQIRQRVSDALASNGVTLRGEFDTSIYGAEFVDTGSTSRGSNVPGDYDFDMSLQLDPNDIKRLGEISGVVKEALKLQEDKSHTETDYVQVRAIGSEIIEGETLDIDIGIGKRSDDGIFASSDAVSQKLDSIRATLGEDAYNDVLANIVLAKKILIEGHAYKKLEDGGMGGIGVENWIVLHNGNVLDAFQSFWDASHSETGEILPYEEFARRYKVFDAGLNIKYNNHDNFIQVLKPNGYAAMVESIGGYLGYA